MKSWIRNKGRGFGNALLRKVLPYSLNGDRLFALYDFLVKCRRFPRHKLLFNDYLVWLKLSGELLSLPRQIVSDKEFCKLFVDYHIGPGRTVPTFAIYKTKEEITLDAFPADCVIKTTHSWNKTIIRRNGQFLNLDEIRGFFDDSRYRWTREMNYKHLEAKVIVEPIIFNAEMIEFKVHCYNGTARIISVQAEEQGALERFDRQWERLPIRQRTRPLPKVSTPRPACLDEVLEAADTLAQQFEYIRVDFFIKNEEWLVGELTNCHMNIAPFMDREGEELFSRVLFS